MHQLTTILLSLTTILAACTDEAPVDAGHAFPPTYREAECRRMCTPELALCGDGGDVEACRRDCELATGPGPDYCPFGGSSWRSWECGMLCGRGATCDGADGGACIAACQRWEESDEDAYCPGSL